MKPLKIFDPSKQYTGEEANDIVSARITHVYQNGDKSSEEFGAWRPEPTWSSNARAEAYLIGVQFRKPKCDHKGSLNIHLKKESKVELFWDGKKMGELNGDSTTTQVDWKNSDAKFCPNCGKDLHE